MKQWQGQFKSQMEESIKHIEEKTKEAIDGHQAKTAQDTAFIREEVAKQGVFFQNQQAANAKQWTQVEQRIATLTSNCEEKFGTVDKTLAETGSGPSQYLSVPQGTIQSDRC